MFCPKCGKEYAEDIYVCAECGVSLAPELPLDSANESLELAEFEEILFTPNAGDMAVIKSLLGSEGIAYYFRGEFLSSAHPLTQPARLVVRIDQAEEVKEILKNLNITFAARRPYSSSISRVKFLHLWLTLPKARNTPIFQS